MGKPGEWSYEPKFDGFRCISFRSGERVRLQSRQQRPLTQYFPEIAAAVGGLDVDLVLDGEVVLWHEAGSTSQRLQLRLRPAESRAHALARSMPASYVVFDMLELAGVDLRARPYLERRACLEDLLGRQLPHGLVLMPVSSDPAVAEQWLINHSAAGIEGVVAKRSCQSYRPGKTKLAQGPHESHRRGRCRRHPGLAQAARGLGGRAPGSLRAGCGSLDVPPPCPRHYAMNCPSFWSPRAGAPVARGHPVEPLRATAEQAG